MIVVYGHPEDPVWHASTGGPAFLREMFLSTQIGSSPQLAKRLPPLISTARAGAARLLAQTAPFPATAVAD